MRPTLRVARNAERQIRGASDWWYQNRPAAKGLFREELQRAFELVLSQPSAGAVALSSELADVRRVLLGRTRYYLYYRHDEDESAVEILAVWHTSRGTPPSL